MKRQKMCPICGVRPQERGGWCRRCEARWEVKPDAEFEMVSRICGRARWSTSGEHAKAVREVLREARDAGIEEAVVRVQDVLTANRDMPDAIAARAVGERIVESIRALRERGGK